MNVIARLEDELAYYDSVVHRFNHYTTRTPPSKILDTLPIFDWQVSLAYATAFLCILLLQYIFKLIPRSELSFRGPNLGPHHLPIFQR